MANIRHAVGIQTSKMKLVESLTSTRGLSKWWTYKVTGDGNLGGNLKFNFDGPEMEMKVIHHDNERISWRCLNVGSEWENTEIDFEWQEAENEISLNFTHKYWREESKMHSHCSTKWAVFLLSLKDLLEKGEGRPFPRDTQIDHR